MKRRLVVFVLRVVLLFISGLPLWTQTEFSELGSEQKGTVWVPAPVSWPADNALWVGLDPDQSRDRIPDASRRYRTGTIDPRVLAVSPALNQRLRQDPQVGIGVLADFLRTGAADQYHLVKRIHDWIVTNIAYDGDMFMRGADGFRQVKDILIHRRTTCGGFTSLFVEIARAAGVDARYVGGDSRSYFLGENPSSHAWNMVRIDGTDYVVDTTYDGRLNYNHGLLGDLGEYNDGWLFVSPESKLLAHRADEPSDQGVERPLDRRGWLALPGLGSGAPEYGIGVDFSGLGGAWTKVGVPLDGIGYHDLWDAWFPRPGEQGILRISVGREYSVTATLEPLGGGPLLLDAVQVAHQGAWPGAPDRQEVLVALRAPNILTPLRLRLRVTRESTSNPETFMSFLVINDTPPARSTIRSPWQESGRPVRIPANLMVPGTLWPGGAWNLFRYQGYYQVPSGDPEPFEPLKLHLDIPGWAWAEIPVPPGFSYYATYTDLSGIKIQPDPLISISSVGSRIFWQLAEKPLWIRVYQRGPETDLFRHEAYTGILPARTTDIPPQTTAPLGVLLFRSSWWERGLGVMEEPHPMVLDDPRGGWTMTLAGDSFSDLRISLWEDKDTKVPWGVRTLRLESSKDGRNFLRIEAHPPDALDAPEGATLWIEHRLENGSWQSIATVLLPPGNGELPGSPGETWDPGLLEPRIVSWRSLDPLGAAGAIELTVPEGWQLSNSLYRADDSQLDSSTRDQTYTWFSPAPNTMRYVFANPPERGMHLWITARRKEDERGTVALVYRLPEPDSRLRAGYWGLQPQMSSRWSDLGLVLLEWRRSPGDILLRFRGPANLPLLNRLRTGENVSIGEHQLPSWADGIWTIRWTHSRAVPLGTEAKVFYDNGNGSLTTMLWGFWE